MSLPQKRLCPFRCNASKTLRMLPVVSGPGNVWCVRRPHRETANASDRLPLASALAFPGAVSKLRAHGGKPERWGKPERLQDRNPRVA